MALQEKLGKINKEAGLRCSSVLSKLIQRQSEIEFFEPLIADIKKIPSFITSPKLGSGIFLVITGVSGVSLLFFPEKVSFNICDIMMKREIGTTRKLSEFDEGILKEIGNIILGNYLTVFSNALKTEMIGGVPKFSFGMFGAILEEVISRFAKDVREALVIKIRFDISPLEIEGYLFLLFEPQELKALSDAL
ncbi:MAG: chemotaxis protein CheC [Candidatus Omnitrophota bacterium]